MNNNTFSDSIRRYILEGGGEDKDMDIDVDADIDLFEITKFNYRTVFDRSVNQNISHTEMVHKIFGIENISVWIQFLKSKSGILTIIRMNGKNYSSSFVLCRLPNMNFRVLMENC